ncbi:MAG: hypothetical protein ACK5NB_01990 [Flavobacteriaceae bacterium]
MLLVPDGVKETVIAPLPPHVSSVELTEAVTSVADGHCAITKLLDAINIIPTNKTLIQLTK